MTRWLDQERIRTSRLRSVQTQMDSVSTSDAARAPGESARDLRRRPPPGERPPPRPRPGPTNQSGLVPRDPATSPRLQPACDFAKDPLSGPTAHSPYSDTRRSRRGKPRTGDPNSPTVRLASRPEKSLRSTNTKCDAYRVQSRRQDGRGRRLFSSLQGSQRHVGRVAERHDGSDGKNPARGLQKIPGT